MPKTVSFYCYEVVSFAPINFFTQCPSCRAEKMPKGLELYGEEIACECGTRLMWLNRYGNCQWIPVVTRGTVVRNEES